MHSDTNAGQSTTNVHCIESISDIFRDASTLEARLLTQYPKNN